jgi:hypothetical protein
LENKSLFSPLSLEVTVADYFASDLATSYDEHLFIFKWKGNQLSPYTSDYMKLEPREYQQIEALSWMKTESRELK